MPPLSSDRMRSGGSMVIPFLRRVVVSILSGCVVGKKCPVSFYLGDLDSRLVVSNECCRLTLGGGM
jgi:hypothetical protein